MQVNVHSMSNVNFYYFERASSHEWTEAFPSFMFSFGDGCVLDNQQPSRPLRGVKRSATVRYGEVEFDTSFSAGSEAIWFPGIGSDGIKVVFGQSEQDADSKSSFLLPVMT